MAVATINIAAEPITPIYTQVLLAFDVLYNEVCDNHKTPYQLDIASGGILNDASSVYNMLNEAAPPGNYSDGITKANWDGIQLTNKQPCQASLPKVITITSITELNGDLLIQFNYSGFTPNMIIIDRSYDGGASWPYSEGGSIISPRSTPMPTESAVYRLRDGLALATSNLVAYDIVYAINCIEGISYCNNGSQDFTDNNPEIVYSNKSLLEVGDYLYSDEQMENLAPFSAIRKGSLIYELTLGQIDIIKVLSYPC